MLPSLTFLAPGWLLAGAAATLLPILAHVINLRRPRPALFPGARFVRAALLNSARRSRLRDAWLLALRILVILLLACAFAQPNLIHDPAGPVAGSAMGADTIIVLDASASMQRLRDGIPLFEHARAEARFALEALDPARDRAAVLLASGRPTSLLPRLTGNISALQRELSGTECTLEFSEGQHALDLAASMLGAASERPRRIVILSDFQDSGWAGVRSVAPATLHQALPSSQQSGVTIESIAIGSAPDARRSSVRLSVRISNPGEIARSVVVEAESPAGSVSGVAQIGPAGEGAVWLAIPTHEPRAIAVTVSLPQWPAALGATRRAVLDSQSEAPVALITSADPADLRRGTSWVHAALAARTGGGEESAISVLEPRGLAGSVLSRFGAVALSECGALDDASIEGLQTRLEAGGHVIWMLDSPQSSGSLTRLLTRSEMAATAEQGSAHAEAELEIQGFLPGPVSDAMLTGVTVRAPAPMPTVPGAETLATFNDGSAFVASAPLAAGRLIIVRADLSPEESDLASSPLLPILFETLLSHAESQPRPAPEATVGQPIALSIDADALSSLPSEPRDSLGRPVSIERLETGAVVHIAPLSAPGFVSLLDERQRAIAQAAVNIDSRELDSTSLAHADLQRLGRSQSNAIGSAAGERPSMREQSEQATALWPAALALSLALLAAESVLLGAARRRDANGEELVA